MHTISIPVTEATPAQIDGKLHELYAAQAGEWARFERAEKVITNDRWGYGMSVEDAHKVQDEVGVALNLLRAEITPLEAEFDRRGGWTRYYLVEGGHLHYDISSHRCSRIMSTSHFWLTELSGQAADEVIELAGDRVCTNCFPQAPVAVLGRPSKLMTKTEAEQAEARREREAKRAAAAEAKAAKAITNPDGTDLVITTSTGRTETIKTEATAKREVVDRMWWSKYYPSSAEGNDPAIELLLAALAAKHGTSVDEERTAAEARLVAREKREAKFA